MIANFQATPIVETSMVDSRAMVRVGGERFGSRRRTGAGAGDTRWRVKLTAPSSAPRMRRTWEMVWGRSVHQLEHAAQVTMYQRFRRFAASQTSGATSRMKVSIWALASAIGQMKTRSTPIPA